jgi:hypothetical protein
MPAAKSRGSPRRSPSSPSKLASDLAAFVRSDGPVAHHMRQTARHRAGLFFARHIHASSHASNDVRSEDCGVCTMMRPVVLPANGFATAETSTAVQKAPARRAQVEFVCLRVLHTVVSPDRVTRWSYPAKRDSKNDGSLTTYRHSEAKHLENSPARRARDAFVKNFWRWRRIVTSDAASSILCTNPKTCSEACAQVPRGVNADQDF